MPLNDDIRQQLYWIRQNDPEVTSLIVDCQEITVEDMGEIIEALRGNTRVKDLIFDKPLSEIDENSSISRGALALLASFLMQNNTLTFFSMARRRLPNNHAELMNALNTNRSIKGIDLSFTKLNRSLALLDFSKFRCIWLNGNSLDLMTAQRIQQGLANPDGRLSTLSLFDVKVTDRYMRVIAEGLEHDLTLRELIIAGDETGSLNQNFIKSGGMAALDKAVKRHPSLGALNLKGNIIDNRGAGNIANLINFSTSLRELQIEIMNMSHPNIRLILEALRYNKILSKLSIVGQEFDEEMEQALINMLEKNNTLVDVEVSCFSRGAQVRVLHLVRENQNLARELARNVENGNYLGVAEALKRGVSPCSSYANLGHQNLLEYAWARNDDALNSILTASRYHNSLLSLCTANAERNESEPIITPANAAGPAFSLGLGQAPFAAGRSLRIQVLPAHLAPSPEPLARSAQSVRSPSSQFSYTGSAAPSRGSKRLRDDGHERRSPPPRCSPRSPE